MQKVIAENSKKREAEEAELRKTLETLKADELYKEKQCRLCPACGSIIERVLSPLPISHISQRPNAENALSGVRMRQYGVRGWKPEGLRETI